MGNLVEKTSTHQFPCQICGTVFQREISGTLLCRECGINNKFIMMFPDEKKICLESYVSFPLYIVVKEKTPLFHIQNNLKYKCHIEIIQQIKCLAQEPLLSKRYKLIKDIVKYLDITNYLRDNQLKGLYITNLSQDVLLVHDEKIVDTDRILHVDLYGLTTKLMLLYDR